MPAAKLSPYAGNMGSRPFTTTDAAAVRQAHLDLHERLMLALDSQGSELSPTGWRLFSRIAWCLYIDSKTIDEITPLSAVLDRAWPSSR